MDDHHIDSLLARGALSGRQREEALDRVLDRVARRKAPARRTWFVAASIAAAAAVAASFTLRPAPHAMQGPFAERGASSAAPRVELVCAGGSLEACPLGARLLFAASGGAQPGYLAAYAEPVGGGGERVWYFSREREAPVIPAGAGGAIPIGSAVEIGPEHRAGKYLIHVVVGARPLSRDETLRPAAGDAVLSQRTIAVEIVR